MKARSARDGAPLSFRWRAGLLLVLLCLCALGLLWRAVDLQLVDHGFLARQGDARFSRVLEIAAHRGTITDRYGEPLAVSTPVDSVWVNPSELALANDQIPRLAAALKLDPLELARRVTSNLDREFLYLARHRQPAQAQAIKALGIPGVYTSREYRRYYPAGEVTGHLLGFTNVDDAGQEGLELAFDHWLAGEDGAKRVIQDRYGRIVQNVESIRPARPGRDLVLSVDLRIQYLAYRELKAAIRDQRARAGSAVVLDVATGEVLAMVNQPAYNPNDRDQIEASAYRNRAATDIFEPGSSIKPFFVAAGLASGKYDSRSVIDTSPGYFKVGVKIFEDEHNLGAINIATVLAKSSNVGMAHIALALPPRDIWTTLTALGFGQVTTSGYPGESAGLLPNYSQWRPIGIVTMSHGYGLSVTPLQLAHAYATIGAFGVARPVSFLRVATPPPGERALDEQRVPRAASRCSSRWWPRRARASSRRFRAIGSAGKTGTAWKATAGGYSTDRYMAVFGGVAPASTPRLAAVVVIDEPNAGEHMGGQVSAPVFSRIVGEALRLLAVAPDQPVNAPEELPAGTGARQRAHGGTAMSPAASFVPTPRALAELVAGFASVPPQLTVSDVTLDSRAVSPGALFLACRGRTHHGLEFAGEALARGACAVLYEPDGAHALPAALAAASFVAAVPELGARAGVIADRFFGAPSQQLTIAGITGTNGKTTCAWLLAQALQRCGRPAAYFGTLGVGMPPELAPLRHTTPDAVTRAPRARGAAGGGRRVRRHGGLLARARPAAGERRALPHRSLHQSHSRSSRLSRHHGCVRRGQGAPVRVAGTHAAHHQHRRSVRRPTRRRGRRRPADRHHAQRDGCDRAAGRRAVRARHAGAARVGGARGHGGVELRRRRTAAASDRRVQRRQRAHGARGAAGVGDSARRGGAGARARAAGERAHGDVRRPRADAARHRRLRAHARRARQGAAVGAPALRG